MYKKILFIFLIISICMFSTYYLLNSRNDENTSDNIFVNNTKNNNALIEASNNIKTIISENTAEVNQSVTEDHFIENEYSSNHNLYYYALELLELAKNGDFEKQYELAKIITKCESIITLRNLPDRHNDPLPMIELQDWWLSRCVEFNEENIRTFGNVKDWLEKSSEGGYEPAMVLNLFLEDNFKRSDNNLSTIRKAISTKNPDIFRYIGAFSKVTETNWAWSLLMCDYNYDCSSSSKEDWKFGALAASCSINTYDEDKCTKNATFTEILHDIHSKDVLRKIIKKKNELKDIITSGLTSQLTWEQILD